MNSSSRFFEGLLVGGVVGFLIGLLYAPKAGSQLRRQLADQSDELYKQASTGLGDLRDRTGQHLQDLQVRSDQALKSASVQVQEARDQITAKIQDLTSQAAKVSPTPDIE